MADVVYVVEYTDHYSYHGIIIATNDIIKATDAFDAEFTHDYPGATCVCITDYIDGKAVTYTSRYPDGRTFTSHR